MKKKIYALLFVLTVVASTFAQDGNKQLRFRKNGEFRIMQITDCHYKYGKSASEACLKMLETVLMCEDVDLIVFTGDNVYSNNVREGLEELLKPVANSGVPFVAVYGNHDCQFDVTQDEQWDIFRSYPNNVQPNRPKDENYQDFVLPILSSLGNNVSQLIYCIDSHSGYRTRAISRYSWIGYDQIAWYRQQSKKYTRMNGGTPIPAVSFFHIPLPEYAEAYDYYSKNNTLKNNVIGTKGEAVCCPKLNSGFFKSMLECGDVRAVFCGHDHNNDFALVWKNILLAYGRFSGGNTVYNNISKKGVRIIVLHENSKNIDTYLRLSDGSEINSCTYPTDFDD